MSYILEALDRASKDKELSPEPPIAVPVYNEVESKDTGKHNSTVLLLSVLIGLVVLLIALLIIWKNGSIAPLPSGLDNTQNFDSSESSLQAQNELSQLKSPEKSSADNAISPENSNSQVLSTTVKLPTASKNQNEEFIGPKLPHQIQPLSSHVALDEVDVGKRLSNGISQSPLKLAMNNSAQNAQNSKKAINKSKTTVGGMSGNSASSSVPRPIKQKPAPITKQVPVKPNNQNTVSKTIKPSTKKNDIPVKTVTNRAPRKPIATPAQRQKSSNTITAARLNNRKINPTVIAKNDNAKPTAQKSRLITPSTRKKPVKPAKASVGNTFVRSSTKSTNSTSKPTIKEKEENIQYLSEKPVAYQVAFPKFNLDVHVYSKKVEKRFVLIEFEKYFEGDEIKPEMSIYEITRNGIIVDYRGDLIRLSTE